MDFGQLGRRLVEGRFDGDRMTSSGGVVSVRRLDRKKNTFFHGHYDSHCYCCSTTRRCALQAKDLAAFASLVAEQIDSLGKWVQAKSQLMQTEVAMAVCT